MIKCNVCVNHKKKGKEHICCKCETKIIYGVMQEPFIECCHFFARTETEKHRQIDNNKAAEKKLLLFL